MAITQFSQLDPNKIYTFTDYLTWKFKERVELIKGKLFKMSPAPNRRHQEIVVFLTSTLFQYLKGRPCKLYVAPFDVRLSVPKGENTFTVVQPDLCVVCDLEKLDQQGCNGAPDLIIEILSPGNAPKEMQLKYEVYEEAGVKEYWIIDPEREVIMPYVLNENGKFIGHKPVLSGGQLSSRLFPSLTLDAKAVFAE